MSFKKTVTFTANVSDYTDGTVSAMVQAENKILGDLVTFILSHNLGISIQENARSDQASGRAIRYGVQVLEQLVKSIMTVNAQMSIF
jgi:hypothetical protein